MDVEGFKPGEESKESMIPGGGPLKVLGITAANCEEWVVTDLASNLLGITSVPLYETLGSTMMALILDQTEMSTVFGSDKCLLNILELAPPLEEDGSRPHELRFLKNLIVFGEASLKLARVSRQYGIKLLRYNFIVEEAKQ
jgi:long-subunit acyl-CoA synthetase (AMP-forming)